MPAVQDKLRTQVPTMRDRIKSILREHGDRKISDVTIAQAYGGMRGVKGLVTETSALDPAEGIRFRGYSIPQLQEKLPRAEGGVQPLPEGLFHLLLTGELPTAAETAEVTRAWRERLRWKSHDVFGGMDEFAAVIPAIAALIDEKREVLLDADGNLTAEGSDEMLLALFDLCKRDIDKAEGLINDLGWAQQG